MGGGLMAPTSIEPTNASMLAWKPRKHSFTHHSRARHVRYAQIAWFLPAITTAALVKAFFDDQTEFLRPEYELRIDLSLCNFTSRNFTWLTTACLVLSAVCVVRRCRIRSEDWTRQPVGGKKSHVPWRHRWSPPPHESTREREIYYTRRTLCQPHTSWSR